LLRDEQRLNWLRLIRSENVGPTTFRELINHFGGSAAALDALPQLSASGGARGRIKICSIENAQDELKRAARASASLVALGEPNYPAWLAKVDAPPPLIYVKGMLELLQQPMVAIVGARNGSAIGQKFTRMLAANLGREGFVIASGLARGIDTAAHISSLERGTLAVLAGGIDSVYPPENAQLQEDIAARGVLLSEMPFGYKPRGKDFPRRNRLISGVSLGVVVIEAAFRSGSLITARFAGEQGREVFAVPGNPLDPRAAGANKLLRDGAGLVTSAEDIISVLAPILGRGVRPIDDQAGGTFEAAPDSPIKLDVDQSARERVIDALGVSPVDVDEIIRATRLPARQVQIILLELDLAGRLERHGSQLVSLIDPFEK
jgi:DNA processing protein